ncbi:tyrosine-type recombinase/integrase [Cupriavidus necator]
MDKTAIFRGCSQNFVPVLSTKMSILTLSDALLQRLSARAGTVIRDRILSGFCLRVGRRSHTFLVATSVAGKQFRMTIGRWPLVSVEEAREIAMPILRLCRSGQRPVGAGRPVRLTLKAALPAYAAAKGIKQSSVRRYESILRTHFTEWADASVTELATPGFHEHCQKFAASKGAAIVEVGRGLIGSMVKYLNAVHDMALESPFDKLAAAGLLPDRAQPRARKLQEKDLPAWYQAVQKLPELQRDYLMLTMLSGLRRGESADIRVRDIEWGARVLYIPETKTSVPHSLPLTARMAEILERRAIGLHASDKVFSKMSAEHVAEMAQRAGAPKFMLHDLRKLLATVGERQGHGDAVLRRILNHKAKRADTLHRHYVSVSADDVRLPLESIQKELLRQMMCAAVATTNHQATLSSTENVDVEAHLER